MLFSDSILIIVILIIAGVAGYWSWRDSKKTKRIEKTNRDYWDLRAKIYELREDPFMTEKKWQEWIPICEYADKLLAEAYPGLKFIKLADIVRREINPDYELP